MDTKAFLAGAASATVIGLTAYYLTQPSPRQHQPEEEEQINENDDSGKPLQRMDSAKKGKKLGGMKRNTNSFIITNQEEGSDMRVNFIQGQVYSPWHDIDSSTGDENYIISVIEIPQGTKQKFEVATKETSNSLKPDLKNGKIRKLEYKGNGDPNDPFEFDGIPFAYGMIPQTFEDPMHALKCTVGVIGDDSTNKDQFIGGDEDPLDIFVLSDQSIGMGEIKCKVIGIIHFVDDGEIDYKVIGVDAQFKGAKNIKELSDLKNYPQFADAEAKIMNWLKFYKTVDNEGIRIENAEKKYGKMIKGRSTSAAEAKKVIQECREGYKHINDDGAKRDSKWYRDLKWGEEGKETDN